MSQQGTYFVLCGLINGERGVGATRAGPPDGGAPMKDGWYYTNEGDDGEGVGPFLSEQDALEAQRQYLRLRTPGLRILGHVFQPMSREDHEAFADAPPDAMTAVADGCVLIWDPTDESIYEVLPERDKDDLSVTDEGEEERRWSFEVIR